MEKHRKSWRGRTQGRSRGQASKRRVGPALVGGGGGGGGAAEPGQGRSAGAGWELRAGATKQGVSRARWREAGPAGGGGVGAGPGSRTLGGTGTSGRGAGPAVCGEARVQEPRGQKQGGVSEGGAGLQRRGGVSSEPRIQMQGGAPGWRARGGVGRQVEPETEPCKNSAGREGWAQLPGARLTKSVALKQPFV